MRALLIIGKGSCIGRLGSPITLIIAYDRRNDGKGSQRFNAHGTRHGSEMLNAMDNIDPFSFFSQTSESLFSRLSQANVGCGQKQNREAPLDFSGYYTFFISSSQILPSLSILIFTSDSKLRMRLSPFVGVVYKRWESNEVWW